MQNGATRARGFTLIELIAVVAILVVLAGLVLPRIDSLQTKAAKGSAASDMRAVTRSIMTYKAMHNTYPNPWDSLLNGSNLWKSPDAKGPGLEPQLTGGFGSTSGSGFPTKLVVHTLTQKEVDSLSRTGISSVRDLASSSNGLPGDAFTNGTERSLATGGKIAIVNLADGDGQGIWRGMFPGKTDTELFGASGPSSPDASSIAGKGILVALGVGPSNSTVGDTSLNVPEYPNLNRNAFYNRFLAVFYVRNDEAKRSFLRGVVGSDGDVLADERADFYEPGDGVAP